MSTPADCSPPPDIAAPPLVGREREWAALRAHLDAARAGHGGLILIGGESGIGKTALAEALCQEAARQGALTFEGRCFDRTETPPYGPWLEMFARYPASSALPQLPAAFSQHGTVESDPSQTAIFQQVQDFIAALAAQRPLVILLDDLHWADTASLDLLRFLARSFSTLPLLFMTTHRIEELDRRHPLYQLLPTLVRESSATRLDVRPLCADDVEALVTQRYRLPQTDIAPLVRYLHERAEGNPLFTLELLRALEEEAVLHRTAEADNGGWELAGVMQTTVPSLLQQVIDGRVARLGEEAQRLLAIAAVIGQDVPITAWSLVAEVDEEQLLTVVERAVAAHLLTERPDGEHVQFVHALIREVLYEGTLVSRRRRLHRRIGEALVALPQPDPDAVAYHFRQAGDKRAADWLVRAGDRARRAYAYSITADRYRAALAAMEGHDIGAGERGWLVYRLARTDWSVTTEQRFAYFDEAVRLAAEGADALLAAEAHYRRSLLHCDSGNLREGLAEMTAAVAALAALTPTDRERLAASWETIRLPPAHGAQVAVYLAWAGRYDEARNHAERFLAETVASPYAPRLVAHMVAASSGLATVFAHWGKPEEARRVFMQSRELRRTAYPGSTSGVSALAELLWVARPYYADDLTYRHRLAREAEQGYAQFFQSRAESVSVPLRFAHLPVLYDEGSWDEARELAVTMRATFASSGPLYEIMTGVLSLIAYGQGDVELSWALIHERLPDLLQTTPGDVYFDTAIVLQRIAAVLAIDAGDLDTARAWLEAHDRWLAWNGSVLGRADGQLSWAAYHRAQGDHVTAYRHAQDALDDATTPRQPLALLAAHRLLGELDTDAGEHTAAAHHLEMARQLADTCATPYERALTLLALAALAMETEAGTDAETLLNEARSLCTPLGAAPALARADALAARLPGRAATAPVHPAGLSEREVEVLRLIVRGQSNRDIAAALFISERTVHVHVRNILAKTKTENRAAATAFAFHHGLA
jgi:ATP/maltotriose-dependent transcriptional regulator MalT